MVVEMDVVARKVAKAGAIVAAVRAVGVKASAEKAVAATVAATVVAMEAVTAQLMAAATEWVMAVARVAELVAVKVADAVVAAAVVLAAATVEATLNICPDWKGLGMQCEAPDLAGAYVHSATSPSIKYFTFQFHAAHHLVYLPTSEIFTRVLKYSYGSSTSHSGIVVRFVLLGACLPMRLPRRPRCPSSGYRHHTCTEAARLLPLPSTAGGPLRSFLCSSICAATLSRVDPRNGTLWRAEKARALTPDGGSSAPAAIEAAMSSDVTFGTRFCTSFDLEWLKGGKATLGIAPTSASSSSSS